jgi:hypothetical protein
MTKQRRPDKLDEAMGKISPRRLQSALPKTKMVTFRVSEDDKESMVRAAKKCRLTLTEYILRLHYLADEKLKQS